MAFKDYLDPYQLSQAGLPQLMKDEVQLQQDDKLSIYFGEVKQYRKGKCILTTHRILWTDGNQRHAIHLKHIKNCQSKSGFIGVSSPKLIIYLNDREVVERPKYDANNNGNNYNVLMQPKISKVSAPQPGYIMLSFHTSGRDDFLTKLNNALKQKNWINIEEIEAKERELRAQQNSNNFHQSFGIKGIMDAQKEKQARDKTMVSQSFQDLEALMSNAKKMVAFATRLAAANNNYQNSQNGSGNAGDEKDQREFDNMLQNLGIVSPVTKETAGNEYHNLLARQLSDFLLKILELNGGMMSLTDVYCIFNRARGSEMVSPDDLLMASKRMNSLGLPMRLKQFNNTGVYVIELNNQKYNDQEIAKTVCKLIQEKGPINELQLSTFENISVNVAREQLIQAENQEYLCRDDTVDNGLRFYVNFFAMYEDILKKFPSK